MSANVDGFWRWFAMNHSKVSAIVNGDGTGKVTDLLDKALADNHLNVAYDVTKSADGVIELIFTPEGDRSLLPFIDDIVDKAPSVSGYVVHGRRPRRTFAHAVAFTKALHGVDLSDLHLKVRTHEDLYHLLFMHDALMAVDEKKRFSIAGTFLDNVLGEQIVMDTVDGVHFQAAGPGGIDASLVINQIVNETSDLPTGQAQAAS